MVLHFKAAVSNIFKGYFSALPCKSAGNTPNSATVWSRGISCLNTSLRTSKTSFQHNFSLGHSQFMWVLLVMCVPQFLQHELKYTLTCAFLLTVHFTVSPSCTHAHQHFLQVFLIATNKIMLHCHS